MHAKGVFYHLGTLPILLGNLILSARGAGGGIFWKCSGHKGGLFII
jgi:hypothetical protein